MNSASCRQWSSIISQSTMISSDHFNLFRPLSGLIYTIIYDIFPFLFLYFFFSFLSLLSLYIYIFFLFFFFNFLSFLTTHKLISRVPPQPLLGQHLSTAHVSHSIRLSFKTLFVIISNLLSKQRFRWAHFKLHESNAVDYNVYVSHLNHAIFFAFSLLRWDNILISKKKKRKIQKLRFDSF